MFQAESHREARLGLFLAKELSLEVSRNYLQKVKRLKPEDVNDELLQQFPRTFTKLRDFAGADDRREFADESLKLGVYKIKEAKEKSLNADLYALLKLALERPIDIDDYVNCRLSKTKFIELCVQSNILQPTRSGDYEIQFDVTRKAIENVLGEITQLFIKLIFKDVLLFFCSFSLPPHSLHLLISLSCHSFAARKRWHFNFKILF